jgi:hypothetical protein
MGNIYSFATRCLAWVGPEKTNHNDDGKLAIEFLNNAYDSLTSFTNYSIGLSLQHKKEHDSF